MIEMLAFEVLPETPDEHSLQCFARVRSTVAMIYVLSAPHSVQDMAAFGSVHPS